jgi:hypothetical protein
MRFDGAGGIWTPRKNLVYGVFIREAIRTAPTSLELIKRCKLDIINRSRVIGFKGIWDRKMAIMGKTPAGKASVEKLPGRFPCTISSIQRSLCAINHFDILSGACELRYQNGRWCGRLLHERYIDF